MAAVWNVQTMIDDAVCAAKREQLVALSNECQLSLEELDGAVQPIIDCCTKEAISVCIVLFSFLLLGISQFCAHGCLQV